MGNRELIPRPAVQFAPPNLGCAAAPLFMEEGNPLLLTAITQVPDPFGIARSVPMAGFSTCDQPIHSAEIHLAQGAEQRFGTNETHSCGHTTQVISAPFILVGFDRGPRPNVIGPGQCGCQPGHALRSLGQDLELVPVRHFHGAPHLTDEVIGHVLVERVTHADGKDAPRGFPLERQAETFRPQSQVKPLREVMARDPAEALRECQCIAMVAAGGHLGTSSDRIPGRIRPFDR